jgi:hypothetical protein
MKKLPCMNSRIIFNVLLNVDDIDNLNKSIGDSKFERNKLSTIEFCGLNCVRPALTVSCVS